MPYKICYWDSEDQCQKERDATPDETAEIESRKNAPATVPESIEVLKGLKVLDQYGMAAAYDAWAKAPERTFLERAFIDKAQTWRRDDPVLIAGATALGLTSDQVDAMFIAAPGL